MLNAEQIKSKAKELGAVLCGIGDLKLFEGTDPQRNPLSILPNGKCIIGCAIPVPKGFYKTMESKSQFYTYTSLGVKYIDETFAEIFLLRLGNMIEDEGYDACLQRNVPGMRIKGDKTTNPEVKSTYELQFASPVAEGKPVPDVIIDFGQAARICGLGTTGLHGRIITPDYGTFLRFVFIITDAPLECDKPFEGEMCDGCGECIKACPGRAISENGTDSWQCSVYYRGAHKSNPFMKDDFLKDNPEREAIINGEKRFDSESAKALYPSLRFLPETHFGYVPCLCGKQCEVVCTKHIKQMKSRGEE
ncbi:MAG: hypothetical protein E7389_00310 [Ruminococcaceae bacterium]|nr:hypothetical protein [Oscillospiraceae bacterium]